MTEAIKFTVGLDPTNVPANGKRVEKALADIGKAGETSSRQIAAATRQLPAQFTDIATQLAGGQSPFLVLLQQGGQIKDSFGSIGAAVRGVAGAFSPLVGATAIVAGLAGAAYLGTKQSAELRDMLVLTGNAAGQTADSVQALARSVSAASQQTVGEARDIVTALAATGQTSSKVIDGQAKVVARLADLTGKAGKEIATTFAGQLDAPAKFAAELNKSYNFLSVADFKRIQALERAKRETEAANLTNDLLVKSLEAQRSQLGTLETAWDSVGKAISRAKQALLDIGKPETAKGAMDAQVARIQALQQRLSETPANALTRTPTGIVNAQGQIQQQIEGAKRRLFELQRQADREQTNAEARSEAAAETRAKVDELLAPGKAVREPPPVMFDVLDALDGRIKLLKAAEEGLSAIQDSAQQYKVDFLRSEKTAYKEPDFAASRAILQGLVDENARASVELIADERQRAQALIEIERQTSLRRIALAELTAEQQAQAYELVNERAALALRQLDQQSLARDKQVADDRAQAMTDSISQGLLEGFRKGSSLADVFLNELKAQFAKTILSPVIRPVVDAGNAAIDALLKSIAGALAGSDLQVSTYDTPSLVGNPGEYTTGDYIRGRRAKGGPVMAGSAYLVGENGPEVLQMGGQGGYVHPNSALGGVTLVSNPVIHIDARSDQAQVAQLVAAGVQQGNRALLEHLRVQGVTR